MKFLMLDAWHCLQNRRGSTLVAVGGLMIAIAACLLVALLAIALSDPDPTIPHPEQVVVLDFKGNLPGQPNEWFTASPMSFAAMLKERQVPLDLISRAAVNGLDINNQGRLQPAYLLLADPDLVPLLGLKALHGNLQTTLTQRDGIAINTTLVRKLWESCRFRRRWAGGLSREARSTRSPRSFLAPTRAARFGMQIPWWAEPWRWLALIHKQTL